MKALPLRGYSLAGTAVLGCVCVCVCFLNSLTLCCPFDNKNLKENLLKNLFGTLIASWAWLMNFCLQQWRGAKIPDIRQNTLTWGQQVEMVERFVWSAAKNYCKRASYIKTARRPDFRTGNPWGFGRAMACMPGLSLLISKIKELSILAQGSSLFYSDTWRNTY